MLYKVMLCFILLDCIWIALNYVIYTPQSRRGLRLRWGVVAEGSQPYLGSGGSGPSSADPPWRACMAPAAWRGQCWARIDSWHRQHVTARQPAPGVRGVSSAGIIQADAPSTESARGTRRVLMACELCAHSCTNLRCAFLDVLD